jgi:hypothetical protein
MEKYYRQTKAGHTEVLVLWTLPELNKFSAIWRTTGRGKPDIALF